MNTNAFTKASGLISKHAPEILTGVGVASIAAGTVMTARATYKLDDVLGPIKQDGDKLAQVTEMMEKGDITEEEYSKKDLIGDKALYYRKYTVAIVKAYAVPVTLTAAGVGAILWSHKILRAREASALAAASVISGAFDKYRSNVREDLGAEADDAFYSGRKVKVDKEGNVKVGKPVNEDTRCRFLFDEVNAPSTWEQTRGLNYVRVNTLQSMMNDRLHMKGVVFLNEVLEELGLERTPEGQIMGWSKAVNPNSFVDFGLGYTDDPQVLAFTNGEEPSVWLTFNHDGLIWDRF